MKRITAFGGRSPGWTALRFFWERLRFQARRIDYYDYLAVLLAGMDGARTLKDVFRNDARRYGDRALRGRLSTYWLDVYQRVGGDLYATWQHHLPRTELVLIRAAQSQGNQALTHTLEELAAVLRLLQEAGRVLSAALWPAGLAVCVAMLVTLAVPWMTVPRLLAAFSMVPADYYGPLTRQLQSFSTHIDQYWFLIVLLMVAGVWWGVACLPRRAGPVRRFLDDWLWWRIYRHLSALRFLAFLRIALGDDEVAATRLRSALFRVQAGAPPWLAVHIDTMLLRLEHGASGPEVFDTDLFTREQFWFLSDMMLTRGLATGLALTQQRVRGEIVGSVARHAAVMRWCMLLASVAYVLTLVLWHYAVIDELRRALTFYLAQ